MSCGCGCGASAETSSSPGVPARAKVQSAPRGAPAAQAPSRSETCGNQGKGQGEGKAPRARQGEHLLPRSLASSARRILLLPGPLGAIELDGQRSVAFQLHRLAPKARRAREVPGFLRAEWTSVGALVPGPNAMRATGRPVCQLSYRDVLAATRNPTAPPAPTTKGLENGHAACLDDGDLSLVFRYGNVSFCFGLVWYMGYLYDERASSVEDTLDLLWAPFRSAAAAMGITYERVNPMIGCFNIDVNLATNDVTYDAFFENRGGPRAYILTAIELIATYAAQATDEWSGGDKCEGYPEFLARAAARLKAQNAAGRICLLSINVRSDDDRFRGTPARCGVSTPSTDRCSENGQSDCSYSPPFDTWEVSEYSDRPYFYWKSPLEGMSWGPGCVSGEGDITNFEFHLHAAYASFYGAELDHVMFGARIAMDYSSEQGSYAHMQAATLLARWGLYVCALKSRHMIHEIGHVWRGRGGHCNQDCCFDIASWHWLCEVRGLLGLQYEASKPEHHAPASFIDVVSVCGTHDDDSRVWWTCDIHEPLEVGQASVFSSSSCWIPT